MSRCNNLGRVSVAPALYWLPGKTKVLEVVTDAPAVYGKEVEQDDIQGQIVAD